MHGNATRRVLALPTLHGWPTRLLVSVGLAGFLMLMGALSFPLPWTPVPFSMMPLALLVAGAVQRPAWSVLSVAVYLLAGGLGAPVFADGESGWRWFVGSTAGYLLAFLLVAPIVSAYVARPRRVLSGRWLGAVLVLVGLAVAGGVAAIAAMTGTGTGLSGYDADIARFGVGRSVLWVLAFLVAATTATALLWTRRRRDASGAALSLFLVMLAAVAVLHALGVLVLWLVSPLGFMSSVVLGSVVFLPLDVLKAALAVALVLPFLPPSPASSTVSSPAPSTQTPEEPVHA